MAKVFVPKSSCIFGLTIFILLLLSVGLLVFVLKGQIHHENSTSSKSGHVKDSSAVPKGPTHPPSAQTAPKALATKSTSGPSDNGHTTESSQPDINPWEDFRLPKYIIPLHYDLLLHPDIQDDTFTGSVNITVNVTRHTNVFVVHAYKLTILNETKVIDYRTEKEFSVARSFMYDPHEYFVVETDDAVEPGIYKLSFSFFGSLVGSIVGFYKSRYTDRNNQTRYLATSKFQPTYARRAFPCYDEPSFKSTFTVSLVHKPGYIALSNMPVDDIKPFSESDLMVTKFQTSVPMVTYLACFIVCDFDYVETTTSAGKQFRVYSAPDQVNKTQYALNFGSRVLEYFENYFGIDYPLPKQDMVAIPDFVSGAMEHWGVITFRETTLLYDKKSSSPQNKQRVSTVISHEMTHMWFGNLVTMEWWDDLWLNEGFASYVEYKGVHEQHPEWDMLSQFVIEDLQPVMDKDSTMSSHPIVQPVKHPDEITEIFDDISYGKGASVLRMLEFFVGKDNFQTGISHFLKKYQFKNAKTSDLWAELSDVCEYQGNRSIASVMKTWTEQMGFPYITVKRLPTSQNSSIFVAKQQRFVKNEVLFRQSANSSEEYIWSVPLSYVTEDGQTDIIWIHDDKDATFTVPVAKTDWVKFNVNQTGYYLVNYEDEGWKDITNVLLSNHELFSPADRSSLLFDAFLLAEAGHVPFDVFLSMSKYLKNETHLIPWETAYHSFVYLCQLLESSDVNIMLKNYIKELTGAMYKKLGWNTSENHLDNLLRSTIIGLACHSGYQDCLSDSAELFQNWTQGQEIPSSLRTLVYHYGMSEIGREEHWNFMWNKYLEEESPSERKNLLYGLAHVRVPNLIHRYLEYAMDDQKIRRQDFFTILNYIAGNPVGRPFVWNFLRENWTFLVDRFTLNDRYLGYSVKKICSYFTSEHELQQMKDFFSKYPDAGAGKRRRLQALENVQNNIKWLQTYKESVKSWLQIEGTPLWYYHRLPTFIIPEHYDLIIHPMLDKDRFEGSVDITVSLKMPSDCILIHASKLNITNQKVKFLEDGNMVALEDAFSYTDNDYFVLKTERKLQIGKYKLHFEFEGTMTMSLRGLYKSSYVDPATNETRFLATTQFEAIEARRALPCFDEPAFKSTFSVRIIHDADHFALSNAQVEEVIELDNGLLETRFEKTLPMVTYLLALIVCDFKYKETTTQNGVKLRVYAAPHQIDRVDYSLDAGSKILTFFESYFDLRYPLKKLDMIAIPDFASNGMENWGLITYSEYALLSDNTSSSNSRNFGAGIISHELAHMWFGDLVTMSWWDDLWLNEGFATYIAQKGVKHFEPSFDKENSMHVRKLMEVMSKDKTVNSHPIVQHVTNVRAAIFDDITYSKGSAVLGMLENYMKDDFRRGVSAYLKKYQLSTVKTEDLWTELTSASTQGLNVSSIMDTWIKQMNYPFITITRVSGGHANYAIQQRRYLEDPATAIYSSNLSPYNYVWQIPITYRTADSEETHTLLFNSSDRVTLNLPDSEWIKFNVNFTGYYAVNYDIRDWKKFTNILLTNHEVFSPNDRVNLLFDSFSLAKAGYLDYRIPLNMTFYLRNETYHMAWTVGLDGLIELKRRFKNDRSAKDIIKEFIRSLSKDLLRKYTWKDKGDYSEKQLRLLLIDASCSNGNHECLLMAGNLFKQWMKGTELNSETRDYVLKYGLRILNDEESWNFVWEKYLSETNPRVKSELKYALTSVRNTTLLERYMELAKNESLIRRHDYFRVLESIAENQRGFSLVTGLLFNKWESLIETYGAQETEYFAKSIFELYDTEKDLKKVKDFYRKNKKNIKVDQRYRTQTIESILENIRWLEMHKATIKDWLHNYVYMPWKNVRLPRSISPSKYNIILQPNIQELTFHGEEEISITTTEPTDYVLLHEIDLKIINTELSDVKSGENITIDEAFQYKKNNFWVIRLKKAIPVGEYTLKIKFSGEFSDETDGISRYWYNNREDDSKRYLIATKFEPNDARKMFPCFDEPGKKSKFKLTLIHQPNYTALSNMPEENKIPLEDGSVQTVFEESVTMSTYLLFCLISDFTYIELDYKGKKVRAYAPPDRIHEAHHGLNMTVKILEKYEEYFNVQYVLPKLDSIVVPAYTVPAMEHWGAITYRENNFLVNDETTEHKRLLNVDRVIAHELAHQWFGNLVTMKWWNDLWLSEGFATLIMYMPLRECYPTAEYLEIRKVTATMCVDSKLDSHPIIQNVSHSSDISDLFDNISYNKGNAILKMLEYTLKEDFRIGLSNYLKKYAFKNTETKDLWEELSNAAEMDLNITEMMNTWTCQMGFPYVELKRGEGTITATQRWFLQGKNDSTVSLLAQNKKLSSFGFVWKIPLIYKNLANGKEHTLWLNEKNATFHISAMKDDVLKFNPGFVGYYVVKYDEDDYEKLAKSLNDDHMVFSVTDRFNLLHDAFLLAETDRLLYDIPLEFTKYLKREKESLPWTLFDDKFAQFIENLDRSSETVKMLKEYVRILTADLYDEVMQSKNTNSNSMLHVTSQPHSDNCKFTGKENNDFAKNIGKLACQSSNEKCLKSMNDELEKWLDGENTTTDLGTVFRLAIPYAGNKIIWDMLHKTFTDPRSTGTERRNMLEGLVSFTTPAEIKRTIDVMMEDSTVNSSWALIFYDELGNNPAALPLLWNYTKHNWESVLIRLEAQNNPSIALSLFCEGFKTLHYLGDLVRFLKEIPQSEYFTQGCLETIQKAITWSDKYEESLQSWLRWNLP